jgi:hypothetical protein
MRDVFK